MVVSRGCGRSCSCSCLSIFLSFCLSIFLQVWKQSYAGDFLKFLTWQSQKRSNSARLPQFFELTTSKTKQVCETSSKNGKFSAERNQCLLCFFHSSCLKYSACHEKVMPGHTVRSAAPCCTCHAESSWQTWRSDAPRCNLSQEISTRTSQHLWWTWLLYCACHGKCILADPLQTSRLPRLSKFLQNLHALLTFDKVQNPLRRPRETASEHPKVVRTCRAFNILTWKRASRYNGVRLFNISQLPKVLRSWCVL